jgi:hypothetical protein
VKEKIVRGQGSGQTFSVETVIGIGGEELPESENGISVHSLENHRMGKWL